MVKSWLAYLLTLLCGVAFYLFYPKPLSFYTLILLLALPLLSLGLARFSLRRLRLNVSCDAHVLTKGDAAFAVLTLQGPKTAAGTAARLTLRLDNRLYPQLGEKRTLRLACNVPQSLELPTGHCGWLALTVQACALTDWLGLFPIPVKLPAPALFLVWPRENPDVFAAVDLTPAQGLPLRPRPGGGPGEDYELRPYRPGDAVTSIHWKLTAKQPEDADPILRETLEPLQEALAVTYDHFGPPDEIDAVLARLDALERHLIDGQRPFVLCWADPASGALTYYDIDCPDAWQRCCRALAESPAPLEGQGVPKDASLSLPGRTGAVRRIHLTAEGPGPSASEGVSL